MEVLEGDKDLGDEELGDPLRQATLLAREDHVQHVTCTAVHVQRVQEKLCFLHNSLQPLPCLHRCKRSLKLSTQCECTVTPIGWNFFVQPIAVECWRGRGGKLSRILGKKHNI